MTLGSDGFIVHRDNILMRRQTGATGEATIAARISRAIDGLGCFSERLCMTAVLRRMRGATSYSP